MIRNLYVILAVLTILLQVSGAEVTAALTHCRYNLIALFPYAVPLGGFRQAVANLSAINRTKHSQCVHQRKRMDTEVPRQYCTIEHHVVGDNKVLLHFKLVEPVLGLVLCAAKPLCWLIPNLDGYANDFKPIVTDVLLCGQLT